MFRKLFLSLLLILTYTQAATTKQLTIGIGWKQPEADLVQKNLELIFANTDIELKTQILPNKRSIFNANSGIIDGDATRIWHINKFYPNLVRIPVETHKLYLNAISTELFDITKFSDLKGLRVGVIRGMKIAEVKAKEAQPKEIVHGTNYTNLFKMLLAKRLDVIVADASSILIKSHQTTQGSLYFYEKPLLELPLYVHLNKKHQGLIPMLEQSALKHSDRITLSITAYYQNLKKKAHSSIKFIQE